MPYDSALRRCIPKSDSDMAVGGMLQKHNRSRGKLGWHDMYSAPFTLGSLIGTGAIFPISFLHISIWLGLAIFFFGCFRIPDTRSSRHRSHPTNTVARPGRTFTHAMAWGNPAGWSYLPATLMELRRGKRKRGKRPRHSIPRRAAQESQHRWRCSEMGILDQSSSLLR